MLTQHFRRFAPSVTILLILIGFTLVMVGNEPIRFAGAALLVLAIFVPFLSLGVKPDPVGWNRKPTGTDRSDDDSSPAADIETPAAATEPTPKRLQRDDRDRTNVERAIKKA